MSEPDEGALFWNYFLWLAEGSKTEQAIKKNHDMVDECHGVVISKLKLFFGFHGVPHNRYR